MIDLSGLENIPFIEILNNIYIKIFSKDCSRIEHHNFSIIGQYKIH